MKKFIIIFACITLLMFQPFSLADDLETEEVDIDEIKGEVLETAAKASRTLQINSRAAVVIDRDSKCVLYGKNENEKRAMASTTKIMTAIIALENCNLEEEIIVSKKAAGVGGSRLGLSSGDKITMNDLIYGMMLRSRE